MESIAKEKISKLLVEEKSHFEKIQAHFYSTDNSVALELKAPLNKLDELKKAAEVGYTYLCGELKPASFQIDASQMRPEVFLPTPIDHDIPGEGRYDYLFKCILVGASGVGKTSVLLKYVDEEYKYTTTIGIDFKIKRVKIGDKLGKLQIWDTAGCKRFRKVTSSYYRGPMGFLLCFDITDGNSFYESLSYLEEIKKHISLSNQSFILVGMQSDREAQRVISYEFAESVAKKSGMPYMECTVNDKNTINKVFGALTQMCFSRLCLNQEPEYSVRINCIPRDQKPVAHAAILQNDFTVRYDTVKMLQERGRFDRRGALNAYMDILPDVRFFELKKQINFFLEEMDLLKTSTEVPPAQRLSLYEWGKSFFATRKSALPIPDEAYAKERERQNVLSRAEGLVFLALHFEAAAEGHVKIIQDLLNKIPAFLRQKNSDGNTAFEVAFIRKQYDVVSYFVNHVQDIHATDSLLGSFPYIQNLDSGVFVGLGISRRLFFLQHFPALISIFNSKKTLVRPDFKKALFEVEKSFNGFTLRLRNKLGNRYLLRQHTKQCAEYLAEVLGEDNFKFVVTEEKLANSSVIPGNIFQRSNWDFTVKWHSSDYGNDTKLMHVTPAPKLSLAEGYVITFDLTADERGFGNVKTCYTEMLKNFAFLNHFVILVGINSHKKKERKITCEKAESFAEELGIPYLECSRVEDQEVSRNIVEISHNTFLKKPVEYFTEIKFEALKSDLFREVNAFESFGPLVEKVLRETDVNIKVDSNEYFFKQYEKAVSFLEKQGKSASQVLIKVLVKNLEGSTGEISEYSLTRLKHMPEALRELSRRLKNKSPAYRQEAVNILTKLDMLTSPDVIKECVACFDKLPQVVDASSESILEKVKILSSAELVSSYCKSFNEEAANVLLKAGYFNISNLLSDILCQAIFMMAAKRDRLDSVVALVEQHNLNSRAIFSVHKKNIDENSSVYLWASLLDFLDQQSLETCLGLTKLDCNLLERIVRFNGKDKSTLIEMSLKLCLKYGAEQLVSALLNYNINGILKDGLLISLYKKSTVKEKETLISALVRLIVFVGSDVFAEKLLSVFETCVAQLIDRPINISLHRANLGNAELTKLIPLLNHFRHIKILDLSFNTITHEGMKNLLAGLRQPQLEKILLNSNHIECRRENDWHTRFEQPLAEHQRTNLPQLTCIDISNNFIHNLNTGLVINGEVCDKKLYRDALCELLNVTRLSFQAFLEAKWEKRFYSEKLENMRVQLKMKTVEEVFDFLKLGISRASLEKGSPFKLQSYLWKLNDEKQTEVLNWSLKYHDWAPLSLQLKRHRIYKTTQCSAESLLSHEVLKPFYGVVYLFAAKAGDEHAMLGVECVTPSGQHIFKIGHLVRDEKGKPLIRSHEVRLENLLKYVNEKYYVARFPGTYSDCKQLLKEMQAEINEGEKKINYSAFVIFSQTGNCLTWAATKIISRLGHTFLAENLSWGHVPSTTVRGLTENEKCRVTFRTEKIMPQNILFKLEPVPVVIPVSLNESDKVLPQRVKYFVGRFQ